jgi:tRNA1Val (adenine37-N6)-methyltransferase
MARVAHLTDPTLGPLTDDRLTSDYRVFQRLRGHRFSVDDVATAYVAASAAPEATRILDLGTGLGSVLLHLAWVCPKAVLVGVEAQDASFDLLTRNVARNGLQKRVTTIHGDLRDAVVGDTIGGGFDLVSGTPPYFPEGTALTAEDAQRDYARVEYRGGVEAYLAAGRRALAPHGVLVLCGDKEARPRVVASCAPLYLVAERDIVPKAGRRPRFSVWTFRWTDCAFVHTAITLRDADGGLTDDARRLRRFSGFPG